MRKVKFTDKILKQYPYIVIFQPRINYNTDAYEGPQSKLTNGNYDSIRIRARSTPKGMKSEWFFISEEDKDRYIEDFNNSFVGKNKYATIVVKPVPEYLQDFDETVFKFKKPTRNFSDLSLPFEEIYKKHSDRGYEKEFLEGYNSIDNNKSCPYRATGYKRAAWVEGHNCRVEEIKNNIEKKTNFSIKQTIGDKNMKVNFSRISKAEMQSFIDKFNKDVAKRTDLKKQLKELSKQPRKNKAAIETLNGKIDKLNAKINKNRATMKEYLDKVGKPKTTEKKVATKKGKKPVEVFATELKENDIIVDPFKDGNDLKIIDLFVAPDTVWVEFDNGEKLGYAIDKKTKAKVIR